MKVIFESEEGLTEIRHSNKQNEFLYQGKLFVMLEDHVKQSVIRCLELGNNNYGSNNRIIKLSYNTLVQLVKVECRVIPITFCKLF